ncbi:single-stranded DNA-binding protein [Streptomyces diastaticus]|uniref:single-stranded DNA-binding protein n=1 Tax=Streptomyces diastaticus TaxID=1956 RepID=UPI00365BE01E
MNETMVTVVGNVATTPVYRESAHGPMARFRMAATPRRWDRQRQGWSDGPTSFFTVWTTRQLASNVTASITVGEPVIVQGRLRVRETERGGQQWTTAEIDAASVGHDLTRGTAAFRRVRRPTGTWPGATGPQDSRSASAARRAAGGGDDGPGEGGGGMARPVEEPDWSVNGAGADGDWGARGGHGAPGGVEAGADEGADARAAVGACGEGDRDGDGDGDVNGDGEADVAGGEQGGADPGAGAEAGGTAGARSRRRPASKRQAGGRPRGGTKAGDRAGGAQQGGEAGADDGVSPLAPAVTDARAR